MSLQSQCHATTLQAPHKAGFLSFITSAYTVWQQRRALSRLDEIALKDIGVTQGEAFREVCKPVWDVPAHWKR